MTTLTSTAADAVTPLAVRDAGAGFLTATGQTARRTALQYLRTPQLLLMPPILGALFLFIFRYIFGGAISTGTDVDYLDFIVSGRSEERRVGKAGCSRSSQVYER